MSATVIHVSRGREWRGGERQVALMAAELARRGVAQRVLTGRDGILASELRPPALLHPVPWRLALDPRALAGLLRLLAATPAAPRLLHAHDSHALVIASLAARRFRLPLIATRRSASVPGRRGWWGRADRVIALSGAVRAALVQGGVSADRIAVIPSAVDRAALAARAAGPAVPAPPPEPYLLSVGALTAEKGHATLLRAHAALDDPPLLLLAGGGSALASLRALSASLGTGERVVLLGEVRDPAPLIAGARLLVHPSLREALGTAVLEALALGTPVIASATGGLTDLLAGGVGALVPPGDAAGLRRALAQELARPPRRNPVPEVIRRHDLAAVADHLTEMYRSATGGF